ncbi:cytochrome c [Rhizobium sp. L1K21]|uniref:c-type cytochrome n=1 Tax=Rhizobium sp. L1K21 TaxID=2954933 RepID=UPI00209240F3|nr:cytochrome c [Rhizobium sp. L1K21]MCO6187719.1 cytochrome c [Rhizobium sp. L1K21]
MKSNLQSNITAALAFSVAIVLPLCPAVAQDKNTWSTIQRGYYLTRMGDCGACHTNDEAKPMAGDYPLPTPFGTIYSANLTPDDQTGIGSWTDDDFYRAMDEGKRPDGTRLYPAFPYTHFTIVTREDSDAIFAYLKTLEPVHQEVDPPDFPFPLNIRLAMMGWNMINFEDREFVPNADKSAEWNRGRYIAEGLGHCAMCHSPKNLIGAEKTGSEAYTGGMAEGWFAPALRKDLNAGLDDWSKEELVEFLKYGRNGHTAAFGPMSEVISKSTQHLTDDDVAALSTYILDLPQDEDEDHSSKDEQRQPLSSDDERMRVGKVIYEAQCSACHAPDGDGISGMFGDLTRSGIVKSENDTSLLRLIMDGARAVPTDKYPTPQAMPAFAWKLNDEQVAAVATYVRNSFGNAAPAVSSDAVSPLR